MTVHELARLVEQRVQPRVELGGPSGACHIWHGAYTGSGRPALKVEGRTVYVARLVLVAKLGRLLRRGKVAAHSCDNPRCVNPDHLNEESYRDNLRAAWARCRRRKPTTLVEA